MYHSQSRTNVYQYVNNGAVMLKKLIGKSPEYVGKIKDNVEARHFVTKEVCARLLFVTTIKAPEVICV